MRKTATETLDNFEQYLRGKQAELVALRLLLDYAEENAGGRKKFSSGQCGEDALRRYATGTSRTRQNEDNRAARSGIS